VNQTLARCLAAGLLATALTGCQLPFQQPTPSPTGAARRPSSTATLTILEPGRDSIVRSSTMLVRFQLTGARIVSQTSTHLTPDTGHIHLSIDGRLISMNYQLEQEVGLQQFPPGPHVLTGEFVAVDHAPFNPRVLTTLVFEYEPGA
jgi:hypothetical protein